MVGGLIGRKLSAKPFNHFQSEGAKRLRFSLRAGSVKDLKLLAIVMCLTLLYINSEAVTPEKAGIQIENTGFRVKPGMTEKGKGLLTHYTKSRSFAWLRVTV